MASSRANQVNGNDAVAAMRERIDGGRGNEPMASVGPVTTSAVEDACLILTLVRSTPK